MPATSSSGNTISSSESETTASPNSLNRCCHTGQSRGQPRLDDHGFGRTGNGIGRGKHIGKPNLPARTESKKFYRAVLDRLSLQWKDFAQSAKQPEAINVVESRFWKTDAMYLYLSGQSEHEVFESNRRLLSVIAELDPVLVYLAPEDIEQLHACRNSWHIGWGQRDRGAGF